MFIFLGVVMVDKDKNQVVWLLHSKPKFPYERDQNKFWKQTQQGYIKAQTFICVTFPYEQLENISKELS